MHGISRRLNERGDHLWQLHGMEQRRKSRSRRARRSNSGRQGSGPRREALRSGGRHAGTRSKTRLPDHKAPYRKRSVLKPLMHEREGFVLFLLVWVPYSLSTLLCMSPRRKKHEKLRSEEIGGIAVRPGAADLQGPPGL